MSEALSGTEEILVYDDTKAIPHGSRPNVPGSWKQVFHPRSRPRSSGREGAPGEGGQAEGEGVHKSSLRVSRRTETEAQIAARREGWDKGIERQIAARLTVRWVLEHVRINGESITYEVLGYLIRRSRQYVEARASSLRDGWTPWSAPDADGLQFHALAFTSGDAELLLMQLGLSRPACEDLRVDVLREPSVIVTGLSGKAKISRRARRQGFGRDPTDWRVDPSHSGDGKFQEPR